MTAAGVRGTAVRGTRSRWPPLRSVLAWLPFVLFFLPLVWQSQLGIIFDPLLIAVIGAVGLNLLTGTAGQISLGQSAFLAIGGYTAVLIGLKAHMPFLLALVGAAVTGGIIALLIGRTASRLRGLYGVLSTLALYYIVVYAASEYETKTGGASGFLLSEAKVFGWLVYSPLQWYIFLAIVVALVLILYRYLLGTHVGRAWEAIRDRDLTASMLGINVTRYELYAWVLSGAIVSVAGAIQAYYLGAVSSGMFTLLVAIQYFAMIVIGGRGSPLGSVVGAAVIVVLPIELQNLIPELASQSSTSNQADYNQILFGALLVIFLFVAPDGIVGGLSRLRLNRITSVFGKLRRRPGSGRTAGRTASVPAPEDPDLTSASPAANASTPGPTPALATATNASADRAFAVSARPVLSITGLSVSYRGAGSALHGVGLRVDAGEVVAVLGPNGAGKSTMLRAVAGFTPDEPGYVTAGSVELLGRSLRGVPTYKRARQGVVLVPERDKVFPAMTVLENLRLAVGRGSSGIGVDDVFGYFPALADKRQRPAVLLSGGERQMLAIGRALLLQPVLMLLDETTLGLAPKVAHTVMAQVRQMAEDSRTSVLLVEQNAALAVDVADRYYVLERGHISDSRVATVDETLASLEATYLGIPAGS